MTDNLRDNPQHWREQAEQARAHANKMKDTESRRMMLGIADGYDDLARRAEEKLRDIKKSKCTTGVQRLIALAARHAVPAIYLRPVD